MNAMHFKPDTDLSFHSVMSVRSKLSKILADKKWQQLTLDLSEVSQCDSAGLALLLETRKLCRKYNKILRIIGISSQTQSLIEFCGVQDIFEVV